MPITRLKAASGSERKSSLPAILTGGFILALTIAMFLLARSMETHHFFSGGR